MPEIEKATFYFAIQQTDEEGNPLANMPPESYTLTWQMLKENVGFSLSTGENMFTELDPENDHIIRVINGFYFGTGVFGSLLAIQYHYDDGTSGWISSIKHKSNFSSNLDMIAGNWIEGLTYEEVIQHPNYTGKPYIGFESDYVEVEIKRMLPDIFLNLSPLNKTITEGESIKFEYSSIDDCEGDAFYEWIYNQDVIEELSRKKDACVLQFKQAGVYTVKLKASNLCGHSASKTATIIVEEKPEGTCQLELAPSIITIRRGETASFDAVHPYPETGSWTYDPSLTAMEETNKKLVLKASAIGSYVIAYQVNDCKKTALLYVLDPLPENEWEDPVEPPPPPLPDAPPEKEDEPNAVIELMDASKPVSPFYPYPNIMKRNARYRGHRESEKFLNDHQEQIYDIRKLYQELSRLEEIKNTTIHSWFHGLDTVRIFANKQEKKSIAREKNQIPESTDFDSIRAFSKDMVQLNRNPFEAHIVGIYEIKRRMQELDERIAEAERRYKGYENAYK